MSEEEIINDIKACNFTEEDVKELLHDLEVDNGNYTNYDLAMAIMFYKDLYNKEKEKNKYVRDRIEYYILNNNEIENNPTKLENELTKLIQMLEK